jgi:UDP-N-acetylglucosamine 4-epimerase
MLKDITGKDISPNYGPERPGDVKHSKADISKIEELLEYSPKVRFREGLEKVYEWYKETYP